MTARIIRKLPECRPATKTYHAPIEDPQLEAYADRKRDPEKKKSKREPELYHKSPGSRRQPWDKGDEEILESLMSEGKHIREISAEMDRSFGTIARRYKWARRQEECKEEQEQITRKQQKES